MSHFLNENIKSVSNDSQSRLRKAENSRQRQRISTAWYSARVFISRAINLANLEKRQTPLCLCQFPRAVYKPRSYNFPFSPATGYRCTYRCVCGYRKYTVSARDYVCRAQSSPSPYFLFNFSAQVVVSLSNTYVHTRAH